MPQQRPGQIHAGSLKEHPRKQVGWLSLGWGQDSFSPSLAKVHYQL